MKINIKKSIAVVWAMVFIMMSAVETYAQEKAAMGFSVRPFSPPSAGKAGINFDENIIFDSTVLDAQAGYMLYSPGTESSSYISIDADYRIGEKALVSVTGIYGMGKEYEMYNTSGLMTGTYKPGQMLIQAGGGYRFMKQLAAMVNLKYMRENLSPEAAYGSFAADIAIDGRFNLSSSSEITAEAGVFNIGTGVTSASGVKFDIPSSIRLGAGYIGNFGNGHQMRVLAQMDYYLAGSTSAALAAQMKIADLVSIRAGYRYGGKSVLPSFASVGAGIKLMGVKLDAAYLIGSKDSPIANTFALSLGYTF